VFSSFIVRGIDNLEGRIIIMYFQIKEVILWSRNPSLDPRRLIFNLGEVNIISGASRTGKSAVIPIIDYCLGSEKCRIPVKTVRDYCEWFGIVVQTSEGQKLFARREPGTQLATGDMFIKAGPVVDIPKRIESKNTTVENVRRMLDELANLTNLDFDAEALNVGFKKRPSFRDLSPFNFQPQNLVANPEVLFYKTDNYEHREKLRTIFPYILNAVTARLLSLQHELAELRKELLRKERELEAVKRISERWVAEVKAKTAEAKEFGLIQEKITTDANIEQQIEILRTIVLTYKDEIKITDGTISEAVGELVGIQKEEVELSRELSLLKSRSVEMSSLKESASQYRDALQIQKDRLKISEWLKDLSTPDKACPICGNHLSNASDKLEELYKSLKEVEQDTGDFKSIPLAFDREFERIRSEITTITEKLKGVKHRKQILEKSSDEVRQRQYESLKVSRFVGNLEQALQTYTNVSGDSELVNEVKELKDRVRALENEISLKEIKARIDRALDKINLNVGRLLPELDCERPNDPISLSIDDLTITIKGQNREDYLWEVGSGSNWVAYHVAVSLGLQQFFLSLEHSPVPNFLVYDQPSQVYFPRRIATKAAEIEVDSNLKDEDVDAVRKIFKVIANVVKNSDGKLQAIVLDHAGENVWGGIVNTHLTEEWRKGLKLVPLNWIEGSTIG
jgi:hypothetical protein